MKGRYTSVHMSIYGGVIPHGRRVAQLGVTLSPAARQRLRWFDYYEAHGRNARLTCRHFGISPQTFYGWRRRYHPGHLQTLESAFRRPRRVRQPTASPALVEAVLALRQQYPRWGKDKLVVLLRKQGRNVSTSMVGRILKRLKDRGVLVEPVRGRLVGSRRPWRRPYAMRKPKEYLVQTPGDLVQVDTLDVRPVADVMIKHFGGRDVISRWDVMEAHLRATSRTAETFLDALTTRMPFPVKAIQVDGGSEYAGDFEVACQRRGIRLFTLPPRSPKLNGHVERAHRTHREEFYEVTDVVWTVAELNRALHTWEQTYNTVRPHQALGYLTPLEFLTRWLTDSGKEEVSTI